MRRACLVLFGSLLAVSVAVALEPAGAAKRTPEKASVAKAISRLEPEARRKWPDSFAGLWMDRAVRRGKTREFTLRRTALELGPGERRTVELGFEDPGAVASLRRVLKRKAYRRESAARIGVRASDAAGNSTARQLVVGLGGKRSRAGSSTSRTEARSPVQLGQVAPIDTADCGVARNQVQSSTGPGRSYEVPVDGVITRWSHTGAPDDAGSGRLQVWRRAGGTSYQLVGRSSLQGFSPGANSFATSIRVRAGDLLGLRSDAEAGCIFFAELDDVVRYDGPGASDPGAGATRNMSFDDPEARVNVAATLEPDEGGSTLVPDEGVALDVEAAKRQRPDRLSLAVSCPEEACEAEITGLARAVRASKEERVFVAFADRAKRRVRALKRGFRRPGLLRAVPVERSLRELEEVQARMVADREAFRSTGAPFPGIADELYDLDVDVRRNAPVVIVDNPTDAAVAALRSRYGQLVIVEHGVPAAPNVLYPCKSREVCYRLRSGLRTETKTGSGCSTAFMAFLGRSTKNRGVLSAAHCGGPNPDNPNPDLGAPRYHGGTNPLQYGTVQREQFAGKVDAEWHYVSREPFKSLKPPPWIYRDSAHPGDLVRDVGKPQELVIGSTLCKAGVTTDYSCGQVTSKNYSPSYITWSSEFVRAKYCSQKGDSGAGVFKPTPGLKIPGQRGRQVAVGIHSGSAKETPCSSSSHYSLFGHIKYAESALGVRVPIAALP